MNSRVTLPSAFFFYIQKIVLINLEKRIGRLVAG